MMTQRANLQIMKLCSLTNQSYQHLGAPPILYVTHVVDVDIMPKNVTKEAETSSQEMCKDELQLIMLSTEIPPRLIHQLHLKKPIMHCLHRIIVHQGK